MSVCALWTVQRSLFNIWQWEEALQWQMCFVVSGDVELWGAEPLSCEQSCAAALGCRVGSEQGGLPSQPLGSLVSPSLFPSCPAQPGHPMAPRPRLLPLGHLQGMEVAAKPELLSHPCPGHGVWMENIPYYSLSVHELPPAGLRGQCCREGELRSHQQNNAWSSASGAEPLCLSPGQAGVIGAGRRGSTGVCVCRAQGTLSCSSGSALLWEVLARPCPWEQPLLPCHSITALGLPLPQLLGQIRAGTFQSCQESGGD